MEQGVRKCGCTATAMTSQGGQLPSSSFTTGVMQALWRAGYEAATKHAEKIVQLVDMMRLSGCPCFVGGKQSIEHLRRRLHAERSTVDGLVTESIDAWTTRQYDFYQRARNGIL